MADVLYDEIADWWPLISAPTDYKEEAGFYTEILQRACNPRTVLELGSGGGNNASFMKRHFQVTLLDLSPAMLEVSRALNPDCEHVQGDMRKARLSRQFDAVFIHDAVMHMATRDYLQAAIQTAAAHCKLGGAILIAPDCTQETFKPTTGHGGEDGSGRSARYLEWAYDEDLQDEQITVEMIYILKEQGKPAQIHHETWQEGLFSEATWLTLLKKAGLSAEKQTVNHTGVGEIPIFLARK